MQKQGQIGSEQTSQSSSSTGAQALFDKIAATISPEIVQNTGAVFLFDLSGKEAGKWLIDLKNGDGKYFKRVS